MNATRTRTSCGGAARWSAIATVLLLGGCGELDSSNPSGEGGSEDSGGVPMEGHTVRCCFRGFYDVNDAHCGCAETAPLFCIDPDVWDVDDDGLEGSELQAFCQQKCEPAWGVHDDPANLWTFRECGGEVMDPGPLDTQEFTSCLALNPDQPAPYLLPATRVEQQFACEPNEDGLPSYGESPYDNLPPTHEGTFASGAHGGDVLDLEISGAVVQPEYEMSVRFALEKGCDVDGGACILTVSAIEMMTTSPIEVGDYWAIGGSMLLNEREVTDVFFDPCVAGTCKGRFELSEALHNAIGVNLFWLQRGASGTDEGAIHIPIDSLTGNLEIDTQGKAGTLRLVGRGSGYFGSDWATLDLDVVGDVDPL